MNNKNKTLIVVIVLIIVLLTAGGVFLIYLGDKNNTFENNKNKLSEQTINFTQNCFKLTYYGCDSETWVEVELNDSQVKEIFKDKINPKYESGINWLNLASDICNDITINIDKEEGLSNGDVITVSLDVPKKYLDKYNLILGETEFEIIVSGREDKYEYDPFSDIIFMVNNNEDGTQSVRLINSNELLQGYEVNYLYDFVGADNTHLTIEEIQLNDEITIYFNEEIAAELYSKGIVATSMSKTIKVEENNINKVTDKAELTEEFLLMLKEDANNVILDVYSKYSNVTIKDIMFIDGWFTNNYSIGENKLTLVYQINFLYGEAKKEATLYLALSTYMIYKDYNGELYILGIQNEPYSATTLVDSSIMLQIQGEKLEDIMKELQGYTKID